jgi:hypothetical protein
MRLKEHSYGNVKGKGVIFLTGHIRGCHRERGWNHYDARKWPIFPFDVSRDFIISKEILV